MINEKSDRVIVVFSNVTKITNISNIINFKIIKAPIIVTMTCNNKIENFSIINISHYSSSNAIVHLKAMVPHLSTNEIEKIVKDTEKNKELIPLKINEIAGILKNEITMTANEFCKINSPNGLIDFMIKKLETQFQDAIKILQLITLIDSDYISFELLKSIKTNNHFKQSLQKLENFNLITILNSNTPRVGIKVHRIIKNNLDKYFHASKTHSIKEELKNEILKILDNLFFLVNKNPLNGWEQAIDNIGHITMFLNKIDIEHHKTISAKLLNKLGAYYFNLEKNFESSLHSAEKSLKLRQKICQGESPDIAQSFLSIGISHESLGNDNKALDFKLKSLKMRRKIFHSDHPDIAKTLKSIGYSFERLGNDKKAFSFYQKSLIMRQKLNKGDHKDIAKSLTAVGNSLSRLGDDQGAFDYHKNALDMRCRLYGGDHVEKAESYNNISICYERLGDDNKAFECKIMALDMRRKLFQKFHPILADTLVNIAYSYERLGNDLKAYEICKEALEIRLKYYQGANENVAASLNSVGIALSRLGDDKKALNYFKEALDMRKILFQKIQKEKKLLQMNHFHYLD